MDMVEMALRIGRLEEASFNASRANLRLLSVILGRLVANEALTITDVAKALGDEAALIESLRSEGSEVRLEAQALEGLAADLRETLCMHPREPSLLDGWRLDPKEPAWPHYPAGPDDLEPANQP
jgi:hypothetical protein